tara:strand:+ start:1363 stop:1608 length:246 start_codon:yes stop_codon:yes gene_type:complete
MDKDYAVQQIQKMLGDKHIHLTDIIPVVVEDVATKGNNFKATGIVPMSKDRYIWYKNEIDKLRKLDKLITDKVRSTYSIKN